MQGHRTMSIMHEIYKPKNGLITIQLPPDFVAEEVEIIVLPRTSHADTDLFTQIDIQNATDRFLNMDISHFTPKQRIAFEKSCQRLQSHSQEQGPLYDLYAGMVTMADDLLSPLPEEELDLFDGSTTDVIHLTDY